MIIINKRSFILIYIDKSSPVADKLKKVFSDMPDKKIARIGGDEFLVIIYDANERVLKQKKKELLESCDHVDVDKQVSVSIGLAYEQKGDLSIYHLIKHCP